MDYAKATRKLCKDNGVTMAELAHRTGQTPQNLCNRLKKGTIRFDEYIEYAQALGAKFEYVLTMPGEEAPLASSVKDAVSTELSLLEAEVELERRYNDYLVEITRDIRTPLGSIVGSTELALAHSDDKAKLSVALENIRVSAQQIGSLVDDVLRRRRGGSEDTAAEETEIDTAVDERVIEGARVLVVEDNDMNRDIMKEFLTEHGMIVEEAANGKIAFEMIKAAAAGYYSIVLMDINMPTMDGIEATKHIRALPNRIRANVPIIAITANAGAEDREEALNAGMDDHLPKPFSSEKLFNTIAKYL